MTISDHLTRTELRRIAEEFKTERDAAKADALRAFDERNILQAQLTASEAEVFELRWGLSQR